MNKKTELIFLKWIQANLRVDRSQRWLILEKKHREYADGFEDAMNLVYSTFIQVTVVPKKKQNKKAKST